jgi:RNA polymerase sigma-70 factor (ECF subfamily)
MQDLPDEELLALTARGRHDAFEVLVRRHQRRISGMACRFTGNRDDAEDVAQEVFVTAWQWASRWKPEAKFTTWLYRVAVNACLNWKKRSRPVLVAELDDRPAAGEGADEALVRREGEAAIAAAVQSLPPNQRLALILKRFENRSTRDIAEALETTDAAVESLLQRAYDGLREKLRAGFSPARC